MVLVKDGEKIEGRMKRKECKGKKYEIRRKK